MKCLAKEAQVFDTDSLHLVQESGDIFVESILMSSEAVFAEPDQSNELEETEMEVDQTRTQAEISVQPGGSGTQKQVKPAEPDLGTKRERIVALENRMKSLEQKSLADNLVFARNREDLDYISNEKKEDRLIHPNAN